MTILIGDGKLIYSSFKLFKSQKVVLLFWQKCFILQRWKNNEYWFDAIQYLQHFLKIKYSLQIKSLKAGNIGC